jgi:sugar diacid utilization regulator
MPEMVGDALVSVSADEDSATEILCCEDLDATVLTALNAVIAETGADVAGILLADDDRARLRMRACTGHRTIQTQRLCAARGQGVVGRVFELGAPLNVHDICADPSNEFLSIARRDGTRSAMGAPMVSGGEVVGAVMAWGRCARAFTDAHLNALIRIAHVTTIATERASRHEAACAEVRRLGDDRHRLERERDVLARGADFGARLGEGVLEGIPLGDLTTQIATELDARVAVLDGGLTTLSGSCSALAARHVAAHRRERFRYVTPDPARSDAGGIAVRDLVVASELVGFLCVELGREPRDVDRLLVEHAARACALALGIECARVEGRAAARRDFLCDLLDGRVHDETQAHLWAQSLRVRLPAAMRVLVLRLGGAEPDGGEPSAVADEALALDMERAAEAATGVRMLVAPRGATIAALVPAGDDPAAARLLGERIAERVAADHPGLALTVGISGEATSTGELPEAYAQACSALSAAPLISGPTQVAVLDELGVLQFLLAPGDHDALSRFAHTVLGTVIAYDEEHQSQLIRTVDQYLANDCNLQRTAEQVFVHPKTVRYRLDRVEEMCGLDFSRQRDRFDAQLAISIVSTLAIGAVAA